MSVKCDSAGDTNERKSCTETNNRNHTQQRTVKKLQK